MSTHSSVAALIAKSLKGDQRAMARLLSTVEDRRPEAAEVLAGLYPRSGTAWTVGFTGAPGSGKSTLVDGLIAHLRGMARRVGVIAVDPSSPFTGGAILGDRVRMQSHASDSGVFVRSMANRGHLGGLAATAEQLLTVLDAIGFDPVIVETVGVGQSEVEVASVVDTTVVVITPGAGDSVQSFKAGLMEVADVFCVNKAERPGTDLLVADLRQLAEGADTTGWTIPIVQTTATEASGIDELWAAVEAHRVFLGTDGRGEQVRSGRALATFRRALVSALVERVATNPLDPEVEARIIRRDVDPWSAALEQAAETRT